MIPRSFADIRYKPGRDLVQPGPIPLGEVADQAVEEITRLGSKVIDADWPLTRQAASFKARYRLAYADCFAAALAKIHHCPVVTGDPEFKQLEKEIQVLWI